MSRFCIGVAGALVISGPAMAQATGPNGGMLGGKAPHQTELVVKPNELSVYIIEEGKVTDTKDSAFRAVVQQGGKTNTINLASSDGKSLVGKLEAPLENGAVVVVTGKDHHGDHFNTRYVLK